MRNYLESLKESLNETADWNVTVTVSRSDLEKLIRAFEVLKERDEEKTRRSY